MARHRRSSSTPQPGDKLAGLKAVSAMFALCGDPSIQEEQTMRKIRQIARWVVGMTLAGMLGTFPACGTMSGGMKYLVEPSASIGQATSL
jgi:hypothetical protein